MIILLENRNRLKITEKLNNKKTFIIHLNVKKLEKFKKCPKKIVFNI